MTAMRILVVTNLYPTPERPFMSPFVKEQVESMRECYPDLTIDVRVIEGDRPRGAVPARDTAFACCREERQV